MAKTIFLLILAVTLVRCSLSGIGLSSGSGTSTTANDPVPSGTLIVQGLLNGQNGQSASGTAAIYVNGTSVTLRLANLTVTQESGLQAQVYSSSSQSPLCTTTLSATRGSKNYACSALTSGTYTNVFIYSPSRQLNYAVALLQ
jgi:hypothetical protein